MTGKDFRQGSEWIEPSRVFNVDDDDVVSIHEVKASDAGRRKYFIFDFQPSTILKQNLCLSPFYP